ncbi:DUF262 domain-containing protein [Mucilaginibacter aquaedulcis]|uniref:DUF262 domain-containing protein n=1 Tax=Mucilaginibacter aquaedulcis TaxID=1187081 RepID=UPI0025B62424|nr:DUF262 domain-containing HNH endonuclease family protein [Mucilaginibacter aquaedulcis]MDN3548932.1 DUF262 domain-containing HNH endonuclease family protein [Mucilaginibacter aquaedulcis]
MSNDIEVKAIYDSVGNFFQLTPIYRIPKYQRSYAWEQPEIEDFLRDLKKCFRKRQMNTENESHFFGQIVCILDTLTGTDKKLFEIVDGQQRISTFILLASAIIQCCNSLVLRIEGDISKNNEKTILTKRIQDLKIRFINFQIEVNSVLTKVNVLELSKHDKAYFNGILEKPTLAPENVSNERLQYAYGKIYALTNELTTSANLSDHIGNLKTMEKVLLEDFYILRMQTSNAKAAFKLFQVLNNRGKNLTEGDLFRAESLRVVEEHPNVQLLVEASWDEILTDKPAVTAIFLRAIYSSYSGEALNTNSLYLELLKEFLPEHLLEEVDHVSAGAVQLRVKKVENDVAVLRKIMEGQWCYVHKGPVEYWDRNRLYLLINGLNHTECLPFLLAAQLLDHREFNKIVQILERFVFRYVVVCKLYTGDLIRLYNQEARHLREHISSYNVARLIEKLSPLQDQANDEMFRRLLDDLRYYRTGKSNKPLKYFLLCIEYFYKWYKDGAIGVPSNNKEKVHDFNDMTIEHIYPHAAEGAVVNGQLEPLKNTIGNLTLLGNEDNKSGDNDRFIAKIPIYEGSSFSINNDWLASHNTWELTDCQNRSALLKDMACKIFKI